jgi:hypothetical protein
MLSDFRAIFISCSVTLVFRFTAQAIVWDEIVPCLPPLVRSVVGISTRPSIWFQRANREGKEN